MVLSFPQTQLHILYFVINNLNNKIFQNSSDHVIKWLYTSQK